MIKRRLPQRPSLVTEVAEVLREGIAAGRWKEALPGERGLAEELQVSRPTLRLALRGLEKEKLLGVGCKSRRRILSPSARTRRGPRTVALLLPDALERIDRHNVLEIGRLRQTLALGGLEFRVLVEKRGLLRPAERKS